MKRILCPIGFITFLSIIFSYCIPEILNAKEINRKDSTLWIKGDPATSSNRYIAPVPNPGIITSPDQLLTGKIAGVQIMTNDGRPFNGSSIQIRGASSLMGTTQPLIVLDGIPLSYGVKWDDISSQLNMYDVESITVFKDAASNAQYGMQGSNGVIVITTKKGTPGKLKINFNSTTALQTPGKGTSMLSAGQFRDVILSRGYDQEIALLGTANTNWNNAIYQNALAADNQLSIMGSIANILPIRASIGYLKQDGTLKTENYNRYSGNLVLSPSFFKDHLKLNVRLSGSINGNRFANQDAIFAATGMDPTQPVMSNEALYKDNFGGYWQSAMSTSSSGVYPISNAVVNPVSTLNLENQTSRDYSYIANFDADYKFHFLPDLHVHLLYGINALKINEDYSFDKMDIFENFYNHGLSGWYKHSKMYETLNLGFDYSKTINDLHTVNAAIAYQEQHYSAGDSSNTGSLDGINRYESKKTTENNMVSFIGSISYTYAGSYTLAVGLRHDTNSRYSPDFSSGNFPSASLTYNISNGILKGNETINDLRVRLSYGVSGLTQTFSEDPLLTSRSTFESTTSKDIIIKYGLFYNRISGEIDVFQRNSTNLTKYIAVPRSTGNTTAFANAGNLFNQGLEFTLNAIPVKTRDLCWSVSMNAARQKSVLTDYSDSPIVYRVVEGVYRITSDGYTPGMFYMYDQVYNSNGKPEEGVYKDINGDGRITNSDQIRFHSPVPEWIFGFNTQLTYKKWTAGCTFRGSQGNYVYNATNALYGNSQMLTNGYLQNISKDYLNTGFKTAQPNSSYYVEDASFVKLENISLNYYVGEITKGVFLRVGAVVQQVATLTAYSGVDPEVPGGVDFGFYPRPRIVSLNVNFDF